MSETTAVCSSSPPLGLTSTTLGGVAWGDQQTLAQEWWPDSVLLLQEKLLLEEKGKFESSAALAFLQPSSHGSV